MVCFLWTFLDSFVTPHRTARKQKWLLAIQESDSSITDRLLDEEGLGNIVPRCSSEFTDEMGEIQYEDDWPVIYSNVDGLYLCPRRNHLREHIQKVFNKGDVREYKG